MEAGYKSLVWHTMELGKTAYPTDNRKPLEVSLDFSWNLQSLGFLKEASSGGGTVDSWGERIKSGDKSTQVDGQEKRETEGEDRVKRYISEVQQPGHSDLPG